VKSDWQTKRLAEVCEIRPPKSEARERVSAKGLVSFAPMEDLGVDRKFLRATQVKPLSSVIGSYTYFANGDVLLAKITPCFENGKLGIAADLSNGIGFGSSEFFVFRPRPALDKEYLYYYLSRSDFRSEGEARMGGAVGQQRVPKEFIESYPIPLPPLPEQRRIVGILDEAFEGIATAKANAEKNLQNSRAIFESHVESVFTKRGAGWVEKTIAQCFKVRSGDFLPAKAMVQTGEFDVYGGNGIAGRHDQKNLSGDNVIIGRVGAKCGNIRRIKGHLWVTDNAFFVSEYFCDFDLGFLARELERKQLRNTANQAAQPVISYATIKDVELVFPASRIEQKRIADKLNALEEDTQQLESIYQRKLQALEALKKSLLHQAFNGELTASEQLQERVA